MAEKKLILEFTISGGGTTTMTLDDVKQDLTKDTIGAAMQAMVDSGAFATSKGAAYTGVGSAKYVETTDTVLFDNTNTGSEDDYPAV